ncbi:MAG TPA: efflux RND transporter periplasmic adaptor subunit, partial [Polyangiaceae bacterium]|nr:efflux RND transporter periplasmic adaptor subunit [Polyangiaceae bacterium]
EPAPAHPDANGTVTVREESLKFIDVANVGDDSTLAFVRSPGRVAFRDGAVARVGAPVHGRVVTINVHVGEHVKAGQQLLTLMSPDAATMSADLERAEVNQRAADAEVERQRTMSEHGVGIESDLVAAQAHAEDAKAELARARSAAAFLGRSDRGTVDVRAPIEGDVISLAASLGATAQPEGDPLLELGDPRSLWLVTEVFERDLPLVHAGDTATAEVSSLPAPLALHVVSVGAEVDPTTLRAPVYLTFDDPAAVVRAGTYARVTINASATGSVGVPASAVLVKDGGKTMVYVAQGQRTFMPREVTVGHPVDGHVPVFSGLKPGERIAVRGALLLDSEAEQLL